LEVGPRKACSITLQAFPKPTSRTQPPVSAAIRR
jgi:hypothetical protein